VDGFTNAIMVTAQSLFTNASAQLFQTAEVVLYIGATGNVLQVSWPAAAAPYQLQFSDDLSKPDGWKTNANISAPILTNGFYQMSVNTSSTARFFRLALP
jgi:hypothetical protein